MSTKREKMLAGKLYDAGDPELTEARVVACKRCHSINTSAQRRETNCATTGFDLP